jgi:hypothetical protein
MNCSVSPALYTDPNLKREKEASNVLGNSSVGAFRGQPPEGFANSNWTNTRGLLF